MCDKRVALKDGPLKTGFTHFFCNWPSSERTRRENETAEEFSVDCRMITISIYMLRRNELVPVFKGRLT